MKSHACLLNPKEHFCRENNASNRKIGYTYQISFNIISDTMSPIATVQTFSVYCQHRHNSIIIILPSYVVNVLYKISWAGGVYAGLTNQ